MSGPNDKYAVVLFDGVCNLCNRFVQIIIAHDRVGYFKFAALQSQSAKELLNTAGFRGEIPDSVVLVEEGEVYFRSDAAMRIMKRLSGLRMLARMAKLLPASLRNRIYNFVARNRYRWFGKKEQCMAPTPELKERFL